MLAFTNRSCVLVVVLVLDLLVGSKERRWDPLFTAFAQRWPASEGNLVRPSSLSFSVFSLNLRTLCNFTPNDFGAMVPTSLTNPLCLPF